MIAEAREIRESQSYRQAAINQAKQQLQIQNQEMQQQQQQQDQDSDEDDLNQNDQNSRTLKGFGVDSGTLVPDKDNLDGETMIAHTDCGTLVPDTGTMVELESNLGTMVINSDSEDSTLKSKLF